MGPFVGAMFFFFMHSLAMLDRRVTEIRTTLDAQHDIFINGKLVQCEYLWACIDELFRLTSTITSLLFRTLFPDGIDVKDRWASSSAARTSRSTASKRTSRIRALPRSVGEKNAAGKF